MAPSDDVLSLSAVIARNLQRLRGDIPADVVASVAKQLGAPWGPARINAMERGKVAPTVDNLTTLAAALQGAKGKTVGGIDLLEGEPGEMVHVQGMGGPVPLETVRLLLVGKGATAILEAAAARRGVRLADERAARRVGVSVDELTELAERLWDGRTFAEERDHRAEAEANAQQRGAITRELIAEVRAVLPADRARKDRNDGDD